jgi:hypothetical protein
LLFDLRECGNLKAALLTCLNAFGDAIGRGELKLLLAGKLFYANDVVTKTLRSRIIPLPVVFCDYIISHAKTQKERHATENDLLQVSAYRGREESNRSSGNIAESGFFGVGQIRTDCARQKISRCTRYEKIDKVVSDICTISQHQWGSPCLQSQLDSALNRRRSTTPS